MTILHPRQIVYDSPVSIGTGPVIKAFEAIVFSEADISRGCVTKYSELSVMKWIWYQWGLKDNFCSLHWQTIINLHSGSRFRYEENEGTIHKAAGANKATTPVFGFQILYVSTHTCCMHNMLNGTQKKHKFTPSFVFLLCRRWRNLPQGCYFSISSPQFATVRSDGGARRSSSASHKEAAASSRQFSSWTQPPWHDRRWSN